MIQRSVRKTHAITVVSPAASQMRLAVQLLVLSIWTPMGINGMLSNLSSPAASKPSPRTTPSPRLPPSPKPRPPPLPLPPPQPLPRSSSPVISTTKNVTVQGVLVFANMHEGGLQWAIRKKDDGLQGFAVGLSPPKVDRNGRIIDAGAVVDVNCSQDGSGLCVSAEKEDFTVLTAAGWPADLGTEGSKRVLAVIVDYSACGGDDYSANLTESVVRSIYLGAAEDGSGGIAQKFDQCSYGVYKVNIEAFHVLRIRPQCNYNDVYNCKPFFFQDYTEGAVKAILGAWLFKAFTDYVYIMPPRAQQNCDWSGFAYVPGNTLWLQTSASGVRNWATVMQEHIHSSGLWHSYRNGIEYRDESTAMGSGKACPNAAEISRLGWATPADGGGALNSTTLPVGRTLNFTLPATYLTGTGNYLRVLPDWMPTYNDIELGKNLYIAVRVAAEGDAELLAEFSNKINVHEVLAHPDNIYPIQPIYDRRISFLAAIEPFNNTQSILLNYSLMVYGGTWVGKHIMRVHICRYGTSATECLSQISSGSPSPQSRQPPLIGKFQPSFSPQPSPPPPPSPRLPPSPRPTTKPPSPPKQSPPPSPTPSPPPSPPPSSDNFHIYVAWAIGDYTYNLTFGSPPARNGYSDEGDNAGTTGYEAIVWNNTLGRPDTATYHVCVKFFGGNYGQPYDFMLSVFVNRTSVRNRIMSWSPTSAVNPPGCTPGMLGYMGNYTYGIEQPTTPPSPAPRPPLPFPPPFPSPSDSGEWLRFKLEWTLDSVAVQFDLNINVAWTLGGVTYNIPYGWGRSGYYEANNRRTNYEAVFWNKTSGRPDAATYHVCAKFTSGFYDQQAYDFTLTVFVNRTSVRTVTMSWSPLGPTASPPGCTPGMYGYIGNYTYGIEQPTTPPSPAPRPPRPFPPFPSPPASAQWLQFKLEWALNSGCDVSATLNAHNTYRAVHAAGPLTWNDTLAQQALARAKGLTSTGACFVLDGSPTGMDRAGAGENRYMGLNSRGITKTSCTWAVDAWYSGVQDHKFTTTPWQDNLLSTFTQLAWVGTVQLGCASAMPAGNNTCVVVVCRYTPAGNLDTDKDVYNNVLKGSYNS